MDFVVSQTTGLGRVLLELKCRWKLPHFPVNAREVCSKYNRNVHGDSTKGWVNAIAQCIAYMKLHKCRFCILSTLTYFYVVHLTGHNSSAVHISDRISTVTRNDGAAPNPSESDTQARLRQAVLNATTGAAHTFVMDRTADATDVPELVYKLAFLHVVWRGFSAEAYYGPGPAAVAGTVLGAGGGRGAGVGGKRPRGHDLHQLESDVVVLTAEESDVDIVGRGRSGIVVKGQRNGEVVAYKLCDPWKQDPAILKAEVSVYSMYQELQGVLLPTILCASVVTDFGFSGFAMEYLQCLSEDFDDWNQSQKFACYSVLASLASHGLYQNDLRGCNFGVNKAGKIVMFDLEDVTVDCDLDAIQREKYLADIEELLSTV